MDLPGLSRGIQLSEAFIPQEEMLELYKGRKKLTIGLPREIDSNEMRIPLTPEAVDTLVSAGHDIFVESKAGDGANFTDLQYSEAGAIIVNNREQVMKSEIVLKVAPYTMDDVKYMNSSQSLFSALHIRSQKSEVLHAMMEKRVTAIAFENLMQDTDYYPVVRAMSEIAGTAAIFIAAELLSKTHKGKGILLGGLTGVTPAEVVIIGAGNAGEFAARAALGVGAAVKVFDFSVQKLDKLQRSLGQRLYTSVMHRTVLDKALHSADVVIGALPYHTDNRYVITEDMVHGIKRGAVIIDLSIDGNPTFETSRPTTNESPTFLEHGVIHYCVPNLASRYSKTASIALSNIFTPIILRIADAGSIRKLLKSDMGLRRGVYLYNGLLTNHQLGDIMGIHAKNIDLLMAAF